MANQLLPFEAGTRQRRKAIGTFAIPAAGGSLAPILLPAVGMLARLVVRIWGTVTYSAGGALADKGPWNILNRIQVNTNLGSALLYDTSGYGNYLVQKWNAQDWLPDCSGVNPAGSATPDVNVHQFPLSGTAQPFNLTYVIPIACNQGFDLARAGLINLQSPEVQAFLQLVATTTPTTDVATNITSFPTFNATVYYEYYEIGPVDQYALPPLVLSRILETTAPISAVGDQTYVVPRLGILLRAVQLATLNGARSDAIDSSRIVFNQTDYVYQEDRQWTKVLDRLMYQSNPIVGAYYHDFWESVIPGVGMGALRDAINTELLSELDLILTVNSAAVLGSGNNFYTIVRHVAQALYPIEAAA